MKAMVIRMKGDRHGVALILVIGMLALMMVLGVTFSIYMRSERAAAGNFRNDVSSRELLQVALARALDGIEGGIGTNSYPQWDILQSAGGTADVNTAALSGTISNWIPWSVLAGTNAAPCWITLPTGGRICYLVLNCSGLLDANYAGGGDRWGGTNANEIQVSSLPNSEVPDKVALASDRPYAHVQDLVVPGKLSGLSKSFVAYSGVPTNGLVDISSDVDTLISNQVAIVNAFANPGCGFSIAQAGVLFTNLVDYVDADSIPGNLGGHAPSVLNGPYVEPLWLYNEVYATNWMTYSNNIISFARVQFRHECFFPFKSGNKSGYFLDVSMLFTNCSDISLMPAINPQKQTLAIPSVGDYSTPLSLAFPLQGGSHPAAPLHVEVAVSAVIRDASGNVDAVTNPPVMLAWNPVVNVPANSANGSADMECNDPRLNHLATSWKASTASAGQTIGSENTRAVEPLSRQLWADKGLDMYVANRGRVATVGELGYLFINTAWQTVRLYQHSNSPLEQKHNVYDYFIVNTNRALKGRVSVNTRNRDILLSVFDHMLIDYPHGSSSVRLQDPELSQVVDAIMAKTASGGIANLSDLRTIGWTNIWSAGSDLDCEAILRNSVDLLTARQQYFLVLICAQTVKPAANLPGLNVGARGVAEIWRDPKSPNTKFIRSLKIIEN